MTLQNSPAPSARLVRAGAYFSAAMMAVLVAAEIVAVDGLLAYAADGILGLGHLPIYALGLGHLPIYAMGVLLGVPSAWICWRVFRSALSWELSVLGPRAPGDAITDV
jgi:hypothetical protein